MFHPTTRPSSCRSLCAMVFLMLLACGAMAAPAADEELKTTATASRFSEAPTLDGVIEPGEWDGAVQTTGFLSLKGDWLERGMGRTYVGFTRDRLYVAIVSDLAPTGEIKATKHARDSKLVSEDSFEIWLNPYRKTEDGWKGGGTYFQTMGIANGVISDTKFTSSGAPDIGWNGGWQFASKIHTDIKNGPYWARDHGMWVAELSIPFKDLGWEGDPTGRPIGVQIARNFKQATSWKQPTWFPHTGSFVNWFMYPRIELTENAPSVQIKQVGEDVFEGELELRARIHNPGPARKAKVHVLATSSTMPKVEREQTIDLPANDTVTYGFDVTDGRFHPEAEHRAYIRVTTPDEEQTYFDYALNFKRQGRFWAGRRGPNPAAAVQFAYYPSYDVVRMRLDPYELGEAGQGMTSGHLTVTDAQGEILLDEPMQWDKAPTILKFQLPDLPDGDYTASIDLDGYDETLTRTFTRTHYVWEGNQLGITTTVHPPFKPIEVDGDTVRVVMRELTQDGLGLWSSVAARGNESGPKQLLAAPIRFVANGRPVDGNGRFTDTPDHAVVYEGRAATPAVNVRTRCTTEYDGCMKVELTLAPGSGDEPLASFHLDIPLRDAITPLWHCSTTELRRNPVGATPAGTGRVWDSRDFPDGDWYGNFHPYLWVGGEERGLCFFADNDRNWVVDVDPMDPANSAASQELIRKDGVLTMRIHFVQKPVTIEEPRTIVFGLMASPGKPMMDDWRNMLVRRNVPGYQNLYWMGSTYWGSREVMTETYPINRDMSILSKMQEARLTGDRNAWRGFLDVWAEKNLTGEWPTRGRLLGTPEKSKRLAKTSILMAAGAGTHGTFTVYWEIFHNVSVNHPETQDFMGEWRNNGFVSSSIHSLAPSYLDFQCWYGAEFIRRGIGLYFDNTFPKRGYDTVVTNAYVMPNGRVQPTANIWRHREYMKRIWVLHQQLAPAKTRPLMMHHMTNTHILPYMTFNESNLDLEWFYGPKPAQSKYDHHMLRAQSAGLQTGNIPLALAKVGRGQHPPEAERTRFAALFVHEIKMATRNESRELEDLVLQFGYGRDGCRVYKYWDPDYPVRTSDDENVKGILLGRDGQLMLVLTTWNDKADTVVVTVNQDALGREITRAANAETGEAVPLDGETLQLDLEAYAVRLLRLE